MAEKIDGVAKNWHWRVIKLGPKGWRTWLVACGNIFPGQDPLHPKTAEQDANEIFRTVTREWPEKTWAIIDPDHNFIRQHIPS